MESICTPECFWWWWWWRFTLPPPTVDSYSGEHYVNQCVLITANHCFLLPVHDSQSDHHFTSIIQHKNWYIFKIEIFSAQTQAQTDFNKCSVGSNWGQFKQFSRLYSIDSLALAKEQPSWRIAVLSQVRTKHFNWREAVLVAVVVVEHAGQQAIVGDSAVHRIVHLTPDSNKRPIEAFLGFESLHRKCPHFKCPSTLTKGKKKEKSLC